MTDPRPRHAGRRSPIVNTARASMPVNIGYNLPYTNELHPIPATRYDAPLPRRHEPKTATGTNPPSTSLTAYNVAGDAMTRSLSRSNRNRSSTVDSHAGKPIIVTTNHSRPHANSTHVPGSARAGSPTRDSFRPGDEAYFAQPASSIRARSHHRHNHSQGAPLGDEFYRLRERVGGAGDDRFWGSARTSNDSFRNSRPHVIYPTPNPAATPAAPYGNGSAAVEYEDDYYEYTKPSELVRYDLDHDRDRRARRESMDRPYYRPHVNVINHDTSRYEPRNRGKPPTSGGLDRFNRAAAAGAYDRPSVTMPAPPAVPAPPHVDNARRPSLLEDSRSPSCERRNARPRPVSLYQDGPVRPSLAEDLYRSRDDERVGKDRRERDDTYRDDSVVSRGFGIRSDALDQPPARPSSTIPPQNHDERRPRHDASDRESRRAPDDRDTADSTQSHVDESRDRRNGGSRRESVSRTRASAGSKAAAIAAGLVPGAGRYEGKDSPRRETFDDELEYKPRVGEAGQTKEREISDRRPSSRADHTTFDQRQEARGERAVSTSSSEDQTTEDVRSQHGLSEDKKNAASSDRRDASPGNASNQGRRRHRSSSAFDPTDRKGLVDLKVEMAALDGSNKTTEAADVSETALVKGTLEVNGSDQDDDSSDDSFDDLSDSSSDDDSIDESRGREIVPLREETQVRLVSPPRDKSEQKPIKGILKTPSARFPEESNPIREGVAPHKDDQTKKDVPPGARWTKISRKKVNPEALTLGKERFEVRDDFVIVLRVLNKEEIQEYATTTAWLRGKRRKYEREAKALRNTDEEQTRSDEERQRRHRHRQEREDDEYRQVRATDDKQRRHKLDDESENRGKAIEYH